MRVVDLRETGVDEFGVPPPEAKNASSEPEEFPDKFLMSVYNFLLLLDVLD